MLSSKIPPFQALGRSFSSLSLVQGITIKQPLLEVTRWKVENSFDHGSNAGTVMLVPGFFCSSAVMRRIGEVFKEHYNVVYADVKIHHWLGRKGLHGLTERLKCQLGKVLQEGEKNGDINLIGHSLGGLLSILVTRGVGSIAVNNLLQLASPNDGASIGELPGIRSIPAIHDMNHFANNFVPGDPKIEILQSVVAGGDHFVDIESQRSDSLGNIRYYTKDKKPDIVLDGVEHTDLITNPDTIQKILNTYQGMDL